MQGGLHLAVLVKSYRCDYFFFLTPLHAKLLVAKKLVFICVQRFVVLCDMLSCVLMFASFCLKERVLLSAPSASVTFSTDLIHLHPPMHHSWVFCMFLLLLELGPVRREGCREKNRTKTPPWVNHGWPVMRICLASSSVFHVPDPSRVRRRSLRSQDFLYFSCPPPNCLVTLYSKGCLFILLFIPSCLLPEIVPRGSSRKRRSSSTPTQSARLHFCLSSHASSVFVPHLFLRFFK